MKEYYLYILSSISWVLYIGITNDLHRRLYEHKNWLIDWFTKKYNCKKLVYYEIWNNIEEIINREKQLKKWSRQKKLDLITNINKSFSDLSFNL